jgi:hypothetical protein
MIILPLSACNNLLSPVKISADALVSSGSPIQEHVANYCKI